MKLNSNIKYYCTVLFLDKCIRYFKYASKYISHGPPNKNLLISSKRQNLLNFLQGV